jgi:methionyl-tRNA formyltransferase
MSGRRLRTVFFGTGGLVSAAALRALALEHDALGVVRAAMGGRARRLAARAARRLGIRAIDPLTQAAHILGVPEWRVASVAGERVARRLAALEPDLICVAHFPWRLPDAVLGAARLGGVNLHASLLPRHRGPLPLFWVYHANDRETGVTVHHMNARFDCGDIIAQRSFSLARGCPVDELNATNARVGAELLVESVRALARGDAKRTPQDPARATDAPFVRRGAAMVDFQSWDVERVWHFLAGLWPRFLEPTRDVDGRPAPYGGVLGYERGETSAPLGRARPTGRGRFALQCRDGVVLLRSG